MSHFTKDERDLLYNCVSDQLDVLMNGDWCAVRKDVGEMHGLLSKIVSLMEQGE